MSASTVVLYHTDKLSVCTALGTVIISPVVPDAKGRAGIDVCLVPVSRGKLPVVVKPQGFVELLNPRRKGVSKKGLS